MKIFDFFRRKKNSINDVKSQCISIEQVAKQSYKADYYNGIIKSLNTCLDRVKSGNVHVDITLDSCPSGYPIRINAALLSKDFYRELAIILERERDRNVDIFSQNLKL